MDETSENALWEMENFKNAYLNWLVSSMNVEKYSILMDYLYDCEFVWTIDEDVRRESDGRYLRERFETVSGLIMPKDGLYWPASFLEVLVAMSYSLEGILHDPSVKTSPALWFYDMLLNSGLSRYSNDFILYESSYATDVNRNIAATVDRILYRRYARNGAGSLFPPICDGRDMRKMSLWDQLLSYANQVLAF